MNKKGSVLRIYLPPGVNCLLAVADHCLRSRNDVNLIVAGKQPELQWPDLDTARAHCACGASVWAFASNDEGRPDVVLGRAGDVPALEIVAAARLLRRHLPDLPLRVIDVVDLMSLCPAAYDPHGLEPEAFSVASDEPATMSAWERKGGMGAFFGRRLQDPWAWYHWKVNQWIRASLSAPDRSAP
jgi:xylulose-5-phosphate/fructose-6-phosphate phosphoketolase